MAHLTCQGHVRGEIAEILADYHAPGSRTSWPSAAIRPPTQPIAAERLPLRRRPVADVAATGAFSIGVAAPSRGPSDVARPPVDRRHLADKLPRADFAVTQFFFEAQHYVRLVDELADLGVNKPVIPGIMPITNVSQIARMAHLSGAELPAWVVDAVSELDDPADVRRVGVEIAIGAVRGTAGGRCARVCTSTR